MKRAADIIEQLGLHPHPEGGWYKEMYRSANLVHHAARERSAMTAIYFLLEEGQVSRWHVVDADEIWNYYEGSTLELLVGTPDLEKVEVIRLGEVSSGGVPFYVVPAGYWQAARSTGEYSLVGCTVAPGFEFAGFRFMNEQESEKTRNNHPGYGAFI